MRRDESVIGVKDKRECVSMSRHGAGYRWEWMWWWRRGSIVCSTNGIGGDGTRTREGGGDDLTGLL